MGIIGWFKHWFRPKHIKEVEKEYGKTVTMEEMCKFCMTQEIIYFNPNDIYNASYNELKFQIQSFTYNVNSLTSFEKSVLWRLGLWRNIYE